MLTSSNTKAWSKCLLYEQQCLECKFCICCLIYFGGWLSSKCRTAELERRSAHQLRLKAVEMQRSGTPLVKSHGDDLGQEYLWNEDEYDSLENSLKAMEIEKRRICRRTRNLSPSACYRETNHFTMKTQIKALCLENVLLIALA